MSLHPWKTAGLALFAFGAGAGVVPYQANSAGDRDRPILLAAADPERSEAALDKPGVKYESVVRHLDDRITHTFTGETPLVDILKYVKQVTQWRGDDGVPIYVDPAGLEEIGKTAEWPVRLSINGASLKTTLTAALRPLGLDYRVKSDGVLMISSRRAILQQENDTLREELSRLKAELKEARGVADRPAAPSPFEAGRRQGTATGADDLRSQAILTKLDDPISMSFAKETRLEEILKYIKSATQGAHDNGIPIYVDPVGMNAAEKTTASTVTVDLEGVPLKTTLKLLLEQLGLRYKVKDGVLIITAVDLEDEDEVFETPLQKLVRTAEQGHLEPALIRGLINLLKASEELHHAKKELDDATRGLEPVGSFR